MHTLWIRSAGTIAAVSLCLASQPGVAATADPATRAAGIIERLVPAKAHLFLLEKIPAENGRDVFEIESRDGKIVVRSSSGVAIASGWNWYLKHYCHCHVSLWGNQLNLPDPLPALPEKVRRVSPLKYRYYLNFCAFSYSLAWYDWPQWEWPSIGWPCTASTCRFGSPVKRPSGTRSIASWGSAASSSPISLSGRAICRLAGWAASMVGPARCPKAGSIATRELQQKIVTRERELGMTPVLQGFTGHVPAGLKEVFPQAKLERLSPWCEFPPTHFLNPQDPLFARIGKRFIEEQARQFGTDHLYASDTFIEMAPPSSDPKFLAAMGKAVYGAAGGRCRGRVGHARLDLLNNPGFWKPPQGRALLDAVPDDRMILLDLAAKQPCLEQDRGLLWQAVDLGGRPGLWRNVGLHGGLPQIAANLREAMTSPQRGRLAGIGLVNKR